MRTFLAFDIPPDTKQQILKETAFISGIKAEGIKWVSEQNLHITVQFIGEVSPEDIPELVIFLQDGLSVCKEVNFHRPQLQLVPGKRPKICWIYLEAKAPEIEKLVRKFRKFLALKGYQTEKRKLLFHITLFRIKKRLPEIAVNQILTTELKIADFTVSSATLYQSLLRPQGPEYLEIAKFKLERSLV